MTFAFDSRRGLIVVQAELFGPTGSGVLQLALDTGATNTLVNLAMLVALGFDPSLSAARVDGLLGLDFFRGQHLNIDFRAGRLHVA